jgi:hypothetical protein
MQAPPGTPVYDTLVEYVVHTLQLAVSIQHSAALACAQGAIQRLAAGRQHTGLKHNKPKKPRQRHQCAGKTSRGLSHTILILTRATA